MSLYASLRSGPSNGLRQTNDKSKIEERRAHRHPVISRYNRGLTSYRLSVLFSVIFFLLSSAVIPFVGFTFFPTSFPTSPGIFLFPFYLSTAEQRPTDPESSASARNDPLNIIFFPYRTVAKEDRSSSTGSSDTLILLPATPVRPFIWLTLG